MILAPLYSVCGTQQEQIAIDAMLIETAKIDCNLCVIACYMLKLDPDCNCQKVDDA